MQWRAVQLWTAVLVLWWSPGNGGGRWRRQVAAGGGGRWRESVCCREAVVPACAAHCRRANSTSTLHSYCRRSDEAELFRCIADTERVTDGGAEDMVGEDDIKEGEQCCPRAATERCRAACDELRTASAADQPRAQRHIQTTACTTEDVAFWDCLGGGPAAPSRASHRLELLCCHRADKEQCRHLCLDTYSRGWHDQGPRLERQCLGQDLGEPRLQRCVRDAEMPCQPSSGRLYFCQDFTDGSTSLYRRWDHQADGNAREEFFRWIRTGILGLRIGNLSIVTTGRCRAELGRLACFLYLKPCRSSDHKAGQMCRSDCVRLLEECITPAVTDIEALCSLLVPETDCVPLPPPPQPATERPQVSSPCLPSPCRPGEVCRVGRPNQSTYQCVPGCRLSTVSGRMAAEGSPVLLPPVDESRKLSLLVCAPGGHLLECSTIRMPPSLTCQTFGKRVRTGVVVYEGYRRCICVDGELVCRTSEERLKSSQSFQAGPRLTPPTCVLIHNQRCESLMAYNPCEVRPCAAGYRCVPLPEMCLDSMQPCALHTCVPVTSEAVEHTVKACQRSERPILSVEEGTWNQPYVACPASGAACDAFKPHCATGDDRTSDPVLPSCGGSVRLYFSRYRLAALGTRVPAREALAALRRLVLTRECALIGRLEAERQLTVTLTAARPAAAGACRLEAEKLRAWLVSGSPAAATEPTLWPVVFAELVTERSAAHRLIPSAVTAAAAAAVVVARAVLVL